MDPGISHALRALGFRARLFRVQGLKFSLIRNQILNYGPLEVLRSRVSRRRATGREVK